MEDRKGQWKTGIKESVQYIHIYVNTNGVSCWNKKAEVKEEKKDKKDKKNDSKSETTTAAKSTTAQKTTTKKSSTAKSGESTGN
jgi:hypothetical protein